ncbi:MAG TPA: hypothetical protein VLB00_02990 [Gemmatimonadales bacterium]|nr:hypothetical protein [Gemmatimonadales bacterium]
MASAGRFSIVVAAGALLAGCYSLQSARGAAPEVGTKVAFDVNDMGRVGLGGALGPEVSQIEGRLIERDSAGYLLAISNVRLLHGGEQVWTGEQVRIRPEFVGNTYTRRFSMGRSIGFGAASIGGFAAFLATRSLLTSSTRGDDGPSGDTTQTRLGRP